MPRESLLWVAPTPALETKGLPAGYLDTLRVATGHEGIAIDGKIGIRLPVIQDPTAHLQTMETLTACVGMLVGPAKLGPYR